MAKTREEKLDYKKEYRQKNKELVENYSKKYREKNREKANMLAKEYYSIPEVKERVSNQKKEYRIINIDKIKAYEKSYSKSIKGRFKVIKTSAKKRNLELKFSVKEYEEYFYQKPCFYCEKISDGVDRVNNLEGYCLNNCVPCCAFCNIAKRDNTFEEFIDQIGKIYKNLTK